MSEKRDMKYLPNSIKYLFVFDAPPYKGNGQFYDENAEDRDYLFRVVIQTLYPDEYDGNQKRNTELAMNKPRLLKRFCDDGFYMSEVLEEPFEKHIYGSLRIKSVRECLDNFVERLSDLINAETRTILVSAILFKAADARFKDGSFNVLNNEVIPLPFSGNKKFFIKRIRELLSSRTL